MIHNNVAERVMPHPTQQQLSGVQKTEINNNNAPAIDITGAPMLMFAAEIVFASETIHFVVQCLIDFKQ